MILYGTGKNQNTGFNINTDGSSEQYTFGYPNTQVSKVADWDCISLVTRTDATSTYADYTLTVKKAGYYLERNGNILYLNVGNTLPYREKSGVGYTFLYFGETNPLQ